MARAESKRREFNPTALMRSSRGTRSLTNASRAGRSTAWIRPLTTMKPSTTIGAARSNARRKREREGMDEKSRLRREDELALRIAIGAGPPPQVPRSTVGPTCATSTHDGQRGSPVRSYRSHMSAADCIHEPTNETICPRK